MIAFLQELIAMDLPTFQELVGDMYAPTAAAVAAAGAIISMGAVAEMLKYTVVVVLHLKSDR